MDHQVQRLLQLKAQVVATSSDDVQQLRSINRELKRSVRECLQIKTGSRDFSHQVQALLEKSDQEDLSSKQVKADMLFTLNLCIHSMTDDSGHYRPGGSDQALSRRPE